MNAAEKISFIENHPLHRYMGVEKIHAAQGKATIELTVNENSVNPLGMFHGGVVYTLLDMGCYSALVSELPDHEGAATHDIHVSVMSAAKLGERVTVTAQVLKRGRNVAFMEAQLHGGGKLLARATVTKSILTIK